MVNKIKVIAVSLVVFCGACSGSDAAFDTLWQDNVSRVTTRATDHVGIDGRPVIHQTPYLRDSHGRYLHIRGINVSGSHKAPPTEEFPSLYPLPTDPELKAQCMTEFPPSPECRPSTDGVDTDEDGNVIVPISYVDSPFPLSADDGLDADHWLGMLQGLGFNSIRLITNWESVQPYRPGTCANRNTDPANPRYTDECYDLEYLAYLDALITKAGEYGLYVLIDLHQDVFSRHLFAYYNEHPMLGTEGEKYPAEPGSVEFFLFSMLPPFTDWVRGHGAPKWIVETCLPEKDLDSPYWGYSRFLGAMCTIDGLPNTEILVKLGSILSQLLPGQEVPPWILTDFVPYLSERCQTPQDFVDVHQTSDFMPLTPWFLNGAISLDVDRCFAALFAGDTVFPNLVVDNGVTRPRDPETDPEGLPDLKSYMQGEYEGVLRQLARVGREHHNVIGYDLMNEPAGVFIMLTLVTAVVQAGITDQMPEQLSSLLGEDLGGDLYAVLTGLNVLPPDNEPETLQKWGLDNIDLITAAGLNLNFHADYLQPFFERMGQAVQEEDENAIIWFEPGVGIRTVLGPTPFWDTPLTRPQGINQLVYAPHWYPDIYPFPGINSGPREFNPDEWLYRDFTEPLHALIEESPTWFGNVPVVVGEFGTYFNFDAGDSDSSLAVSGHVLNSYYEAFEALNTGSMAWCFAPDNDENYGESWNHEDFSIIGPDKQPRAWTAYSRPNARVTSGKLIGQSFISQYHYWDPEPTVARPTRRYTLQMHTRETTAPTEIFVPERQYPDGFYVWLSDGSAYYDDAHQILYWYPSRNEPGALHNLRIDPLLPDREALDWSYFVQDGQVINGVGDISLMGGMAP